MSSESQQIKRSGRDEVSTLRYEYLLRRKEWLNEKAFQVFLYWQIVIFGYLSYVFIMISDESMVAERGEVVSYIINLANIMMSFFSLIFILVNYFIAKQWLAYENEERMKLGKEIKKRLFDFEWLETWLVILGILEIIAIFIITVKIRDFVLL